MNRYLMPISAFGAVTLLECLRDGDLVHVQSAPAAVLLLVVFAAFAVGMLYTADTLKDGDRDTIEWVGVMRYAGWVILARLVVGMCLGVTAATGG